MGNVSTAIGIGRHVDVLKIVIQQGDLVIGIVMVVEEIVNYFSYNKL